jgi:hypothetical protein
MCERAGLTRVEQTIHTSLIRDVNIVREGQSRPGVKMAIRDNRMDTAHIRPKGESNNGYSPFEAWNESEQTLAPIGAGN